MEPRNLPVCVITLVSAVKLCASTVFGTSNGNAYLSRQLRYRVRYFLLHSKSDESPETVAID